MGVNKPYIPPFEERPPLRQVLIIRQKSQYGHVRDGHGDDVGDVNGVNSYDIGYINKHHGLVHSVASNESSKQHGCYHSCSNGNRYGNEYE